MYFVCYGCFRVFSLAVGNFIYGGESGLKSGNVGLFLNGSLKRSGLFFFFSDVGLIEGILDKREDISLLVRVLEGLFRFLVLVCAFEKWVELVFFLFVWSWEGVGEMVGVLV